MSAPEKVNILPVISHSLPVARTLQILSQRCQVDESYPGVSIFFMLSPQPTVFMAPLASFNRGLATSFSQLMWRSWEWQKGRPLGVWRCNALFPGLHCLLIWRKQCLLTEEGGEHVGFWWAESTGLRVGASGKRRSLRRLLPTGSLPRPLAQSLTRSGTLRKALEGFSLFLVLRGGKMSSSSGWRGKWWKHQISESPQKVARAWGSESRRRPHSGHA